MKKYTIMSECDSCSAVDNELDIEDIRHVLDGEKLGCDRCEDGILHLFIKEVE